MTLLALGVPIASAEAGLLFTLGQNECKSTIAVTGQRVIFCDNDIQPTGTGVINPFLRVHGDKDQKDDTDNTYTSGWNTDLDKLYTPNEAWNDFDHSQTNALALAGVQPTGNNYMVFTVDLGDPQNGAASLLTFNQMRLFNCGSATYDNVLDPADCTQPAFFDLFGTGLANNGQFINFDTGLHTGQGKGDVSVFVENLPGKLLGPYVALLDGWGCGSGTTMGPGSAPIPAAYSCNAPGIASDHGSFEEWFSRPSGAPAPPSVPEPASLLLLGSGLSAAGVAARRRRAQKKS